MIDKTTTPMSMKKYIALGKKEGIVKEVVVLEEAFRKYSEAIQVWLTGFFVPRKDKNIGLEVIYSAPNIATALRAAPAQASKPDIDREVSQKLVDLREDRTKIPIASFNISSISFLMDFELPGIIYYPVQFVDASKKETLMARKDLPYQIQYTSTIWTKTKSDMNYILHQVLSQFAPDCVFEIDGQTVTMMLESVTDTSQLETGNTGAYQLIRTDIVTTMKQVWIKTNPIIVKTVLYQKMAYGESIVSPLNETDYLVTTTKPDTNFTDIITVVDQHDQL